MAKITESLSASIKEKVFGVVKSKTSSKESPNALLKVISKNFMAMSAMARDMNVASQNIKELVRVMGGKPSDKEDKVAGSGLTADERERKLAVELEKDKQKEGPKKPSLVSKLGKKALDKFKSTKVGQKVTDKFAELKKAFNPTKIFKALKKYLIIGALIGAVFVAFKDTFVEWATGLFDAIKTKFDEFTASIGQWFQDTIQPIIDKAKELIKPVIDAVSGFITKIGDWFKEKFELIKGIFENPLNFIKKIIDKVFVLFDKVKEGFQKFKDTIKPYVEKALDTPIIKYLPPVLALKALTGAKSPEEKKEEEKKPVPVTPGYEESAAADAMASGIPGEPYIPEPEAPPPKPTPVEVAPPPQPILVPGPMPVPAAPKEKAKPKAPSVAPVPTPSAPPGAQKPTEKISENAPFASVVSVQPGVDLSGIKPALIERVTKMAIAFKEQTGKKLLVMSGYRSNEKQKELYDKWVAGGKKNPPAVAKPAAPLKGIDGKSGGGSLHSSGLAIDINSKGPNGINVLAGDIKNPTGWLEKFGLIRNVPKENWHVALGGTPPTPDNPDNPGVPIAVPSKQGGAVEVNSGKTESVSPPVDNKMGAKLSTASVDLASGQRQQQKPSTPIIVNAPVTNTTMVTQKKVAVSPPKQDSAKVLTARIT
jgi:hypothetical protein